MAFILDKTSGTGNGVINIHPDTANEGETLIQNKLLIKVNNRVITSVDLKQEPPKYKFSEVQVSDPVTLSDNPKNVQRNFSFSILEWDSKKGYEKDLTKHELAYKIGAYSNDGAGDLLSSGFSNLDYFVDVEGNREPSIPELSSFDNGTYNYKLIYTPIDIGSWDYRWIQWYAQDVLEFSLYSPFIRFKVRMD